MEKFYVFTEKEMEVLFKQAQLLCMDIEVALLKKNCEARYENTVIKFGEEFFEQSQNLGETEKGPAGKQPFEG